MHPEDFVIAFAGISFGIEPYSAAIVSALVAVSVGSWLALARSGADMGRAALLVASSGIAALAGARLLNSLLNWDLYQAEPWRFMTFSAIGFSLYGGLIAGTLAGYVAARIMRLDIWRAADLAAPWVGIGIALVRVGCFLRGCCFGETTDLPWGVTFPLFSQAHLAQLESGQAEMLAVHATHPTQLYELAGALTAGAIAWMLAKRRVFPDGVAALIAAAVFTLVRLAAYPFRVMPDAYVVPGYFYPALYAVLLAALAVLIVRRIRRAA